MNNYTKLILADTPEKMRSAINQYSYKNALAQQCRVTADMQGLSGEDRYTLLAYHALRQIESLQSILLNEMNRRIPPLILYPNDKEQA